MHTSALRRARVIAGVGLAAALSLTACSSSDDTAATGAGENTPDTATAETVTVSHAQGDTEVPLNPETVVTFDIGVLDTLTELGIEPDGVPQDFLPDYLSQYADEGTFNAGSLFEPDFEAVNAADPDLIIVSARSSESYQELSEIAPTIDLTLDSADFVNSFTQQTQTLASVFGRENEAAEALTALETRVMEVREQAAGAGSGLIVLTSGGEVSAYGAGSRFGLIHDVLGVAPADEDITAETHGEVVSFEYIAETDPDWLFVVDRDVATGDGQTGGAEQVLDNELVGQTTAWQQDQVVYLDPVSWYIVGGGLHSVDGMISQIHDALR